MREHVRLNEGRPAVRAQEKAKEALDDTEDDVDVASILEGVTSVPLTAAGGEYALGEDQRQYICLLPDGRLYVAKSQQFSSYVRGLTARLDRRHFPYRLYLVDRTVISNIYTMAGEFGAREKHSDMQQAATSIFQKAVEMRASDIHIRVSYRTRTEIYFRIHNDLEFIAEESSGYGKLLCSTIYHSMADVSDPTFEEMSRQDARISDRQKIPLGIDGIRIATSPQVDGFIMVLRLLYNDAASDTDLIKLGYMEAQANSFELMKRRPTGINIVAGPTGSGKSTTLQRVLASIVKESQNRKHIITVEDPPEYPIAGVVQTPVTNAESEEERTREFQRAIRAAMRLDPDILMIGEVRDAASAALAIQAAMTGHQVWTTLHVNNALAIVDRLQDLKVPIELITDPTIVSGLTCQRLLKLLCPHCRQRISDVMDRYSERDLRRIMTVADLNSVYVLGDGCEHCRNTGIVGRTPVAETIITDHTLMDFLRKKDRMGAISYWKNDQNGISMLEHAIIKIKAGLVDPFLAEDVVGPLNMGIVESDFKVESQEIASVV